MTLKFKLRPALHSNLPSHAMQSGTVFHHFGQYSLHFYTYKFFGICHISSGKTSGFCGTFTVSCLTYPVHSSHNFSFSSWVSWLKRSCASLIIIALKKCISCNFSNCSSRKRKTASYLIRGRYLIALRCTSWKNILITDLTLNWIFIIKDTSPQASAYHI